MAVAGTTVTGMVASGWPWQDGRSRTAADVIGRSSLDDRDMDGRDRTGRGRDSHLMMTTAGWP